MAVYTKLYKNDFTKIEKLFDIGQIVSFKGIKKGIENTNYLIKTNSNKYILTIFEKRVDNKDLPFFMSLMHQLSEKKIKCPKPIKNRKGGYLFKVKRKFGCIVTFLKGKDKKKLNSSECYYIGKNIAKLHISSKSIKLKRKNSMSLKIWPKLLKKIDKKINKLDSNLYNIMKISLDLVKNNWPKNLPSGIIHSDLFIDNIIFNKKKLNGFIDFYFSCNDFYAYELSICINSLCFDKKGRKFLYNKSKGRNLINGYQSIRRLSIRERNSLNILCKGSALRYLLTRAYDYLNTPKDALIKIKDPTEYLQKIIFHDKINSFKQYFSK